MVKTRHSEELDVSPQDHENGLHFMSLSNERHRRYSTRAADDAGDSIHTSRAYTEGDNAFNIFEEKVVDSRLRPRTGPSRAYNYLDDDFSEEESRRSRHSSGRHKFLSDDHSQGSNPRSPRSHHLQIKEEMLEEERMGRRPRKTHLRRRGLSTGEDSDGTDQDNVIYDGQDSSRSKHRGKTKPMQEPPQEVKENRRAMRRAPTPAAEDEEESEKETHNLRRVRMTRHRQSHHSSDEDHGEEEKRDNSRKSPSARQQLKNEEEEEEDEETENVRRSSRKRRQVFDTLNQSYLVSIPGKRKQDTDLHNEDTKDDDSDHQQFSDMYSRVKRKRIQVKRNMYGVPIDEESDSEADDQDDNANNNNDDEDDEEEEEEEEEEDGGLENNTAGSRRVLRTRRNLRRPKPQQKVVKSYSLRQHKPTIDRYKPPEEKRRVRRVENSVFASTPTKNNSKQPYQSPARKRNIRKRSAFHSSSSATSSSDSESSDEKSFKRRKAKSTARARNRMMPMNMTADALASASVLKDRVKSGVSLADVEPMNIDKSVTFDSIGGLGKHIRKLKEMVVFPLLYENVFQRFKVDPPRGVLFYGPPGTGKTLVARALANECSQGDRRVAFFMRKGADCLSKWVGESERQLRLLFDQAYKFRPSIIFFDEIDGLAPVRSSRQDQIHSSIVSTLLALMDGLDSRGEIVVIGATNRIDSLDPALRRPGRFDREFLFSLPSMEARKQILKIHTSCWNPRLNDHFLCELAEKCVGYCGADIKALCTEAAMQALRRRYPQIYLTNEALQLDVSSINVSAKDFFNAIASIIPTSQRSVNTPARALAPRVASLLQPQLDSVMDKLGDIFPASSAEGYAPLDNASQWKQVIHGHAKQLADNGIPWEEMLSDEDEDAPSIFVPSTPTKVSKTSKAALVEDRPSTSAYLNFTSFATVRPTTFRPRLMLVGNEGQGQTTHLAPAVIHRMENLPVHVLDLPTLYAVTAKTPEESCANVFHEAKRKCPSILYLPYMDQWWDVMADTLRATLLTLIHDLDPALPLLLLATSERPYHMLDPTLRSLFSTYSCEVSVMRNPNKEERHTFFKDLMLKQAFKPPSQKKQAEALIKFLNETKQPKIICTRGRRRLKRNAKHATLPNYIYPFGRHEDCPRRSVNIDSISEMCHLSANKINKKPIKASGLADVEKSREAMAKLANVNLKLHEMGCKSDDKPFHHMVLRSRVHASGGLNSNQSARGSSYRRICPVYRSICPATPSAGRFSRAHAKSGMFKKPAPFLGGQSRVYKVRTSTTLSRAVGKPMAAPNKLQNTKDNFRKPTGVPVKAKNLRKKNLGKTSLLSKSKPYLSEKNWVRLNNELTSRHERYVRRLQRLEVRMCEIATTSQHGECSVRLSPQASYSILSARHLRYLHRLKKIDAALHQVKSHSFVSHSCRVKEKSRHEGISHKLNSVLSCGSFQMLYKKKNRPHEFERNLSLPLNFKDLPAKRRGHQNSSPHLASNDFKRKSSKLSGASQLKVNHIQPYNLRRKRGNGAAQRLLETLPLASAPKPRELSNEELAALVEKEELTLMELRIFLRDVLNKLGTDKKFSIFAKPVNIEDAADYYDIIETPMDLSSMMAKIDLHEYSTVRDFLNDIDLICSNALEYNPDRGPMDRIIRHRACALKDTAYAIIKTELDKEFEKTCVDIQASRKRRGEKSGTVPNFYNTKLKHGNSSRTQAAAAAIPSYLDKPQTTRTIPKPEGERFSRRVRGLNSDPVPPLEAVEKVFKSSRTGTSPTREDKNSSNNNLNQSADSTLKDNKREGAEEDGEVCDVSAGKIVEEKKSHSGGDAEEESVTNTSTGSTSTSKKKRAAICVWCKPKRKRRRLGLPKPESGSAEKKGGEVNGEEEMSAEDEEEEEEEEEAKSQVGDPPRKEVDQQLAVDTSEPVKSSSTKQYEQRARASRSPGAALPVHGGVSTRRSSMSPRLVGESPLSQPATSPVSTGTSRTPNNLQNEEKPDPSSASKESSKVSVLPESKGKAETDDAKTKALLQAPKTAVNGSSTISQSSSLLDESGSSSAAAAAAATTPLERDKSRVVKRLDLDLVITDSGHGSSLESNGDSRDSTDHKTPSQDSCTLEKVLPTIEALVNSNHNCSAELRTTATAILESSCHSVVADVPRMTRLLNRLVGRTEGHTVEHLEKIYSQLSQLIYRHRHNFDRTLMIEAMERKVEDLTQTISPPKQ